MLTPNITRTLVSLGLSAALITMMGGPVSADTLCSGELADDVNDNLIVDGPISLNEPTCTVPHGVTVNGDIRIIEFNTLEVAGTVNGNIFGEGLGDFFGAAAVLTDLGLFGATVNGYVDQKLGMEVQVVSSSISGALSAGPYGVLDVTGSTVGGNLGGPLQIVRLFAFGAIEIGGDVAGFQVQYGGTPGSASTIHGGVTTGLFNVGLAQNAELTVGSGITAR